MLTLPEPIAEHPRHELDTMIACVAREVEMRKRVYPRFVADKKMTQGGADYEIASMNAVLQLLQRGRAHALRTVE